MNNSESLYDRIGGKESIKRIVKEFYDTILADPELAPFFENSSVERIIAMQEELFGAALGGPVEYTGTELNRAHSGRGITHKHLSTYINHLLEVLKRFKN